MQEQTIDTMLERSAGTDVPLLLKAKEDAKRRVRDDPSSANLAALDRATSMLKGAMQEQEQNQEDGRTFAAVKDVLRYLRDSGRKISQSQLYKDVGAGFVRRQKDGTFRRRDIDAYATTLKMVALPERHMDDMEDLARQEMAEKIAKTKAQRATILFDLEVKRGKYVLREDVALELASRASTLDVGLRSVLRLFVPDYIRLVGGDVSKADALAAEIDKNIDAALTEYSRPMEFRTEYVAEEAEGGPQDGPAGSAETGEPEA